MPTSFAIPVDSPTETTVAAPYSPGQGQLVLADAAPLANALAAGGFVRLTATRAAQGNGGVQKLTHLAATGVSGNTLYGVAAIDGYPDIALREGDKVEVRVSAGTFKEIHDALKAIETALAQLAGGGKGTGLNQVNVLDYRASAADDSAAFQAAFDAAAALRGKAGTAGTLRIPSLPVKADGTANKYTLVRPVLCRDPYVNLIGDDERPLITRTYHGPSFMLGQDYGHPYYGRPTAGHFPDAFGVLDSSAASSAGKRYGLRCHDSTLSIQWEAVGGAAPTGGTFPLAYYPPNSGTAQVTSAIPYNATASAVQAALEALPGIDPGEVACTGGPLPATPIGIRLTSPTGTPYKFNNGQKIVVAPDGSGLPTNNLTVPSGKSRPVICCGQRLHASFQAHPLTHPDLGAGQPTAWSNVRKLSLGGCFVSNGPWSRSCRDGGGNGQTIFLWNLGEPTSFAPAPHCATLLAGTSNLALTISLASPPAGEPYYRERTYRFAANLPFSTYDNLPLKIDFETDLDAGTVFLAVNGTPITPTCSYTDHANGNAGVSLSITNGVVSGLAGVRLRNNEGHTFNLLAPVGFDSSTRDYDITCHGFRMGLDNRYTVSNGVQARIDGGTLNDAYRYFTAGASGQYLTFQDAPGSTFCSTHGASGAGFGMFSVEGNTLFTGQANNLRNLVLEGSRYGALVAIANNGDLDIRDCEFRSGFYGIGSMMGNAVSYPMAVNDNIFRSQIDVPIFGNGIIATGRNNQFQYGGRIAVALGFGGVPDLSEVLVAPGGATENVVKCLNVANPGGATLEKWKIDYEGGNGPSDCHFSIESSSSFPSSYVLRSIAAGAAKTGRPYVRLKGNGNPYSTPSQPCVFTWDGGIADTSVGRGNTLVAAETANWEGEVRNVAGSPWKRVSGPGWIIAYQNLAALPTTGAYAAGRDRIRNKGIAAAGDVADWICAVGGDYAATPPVWVKVVTAAVG